VEDIRIKRSIGLSVGTLILIKKPESAEVTKRPRHRQIAVNMEASDQFAMVLNEVEGVVANVAAKPVPKEFLRALAGV